MRAPFKSILPILFVCAIPVVVIAQSSVPPLISFQGFLTDDVGDPIDGAETLMFAMYTDSLAGSQLWAETRSVTLSDGLMDVALGEVTPIPDSVFHRDEVYLAIKVGSDDWMSPRSRLTSAAWAFASGCVVSIWYEDSDGDGFGNDSMTKVSCSTPPGYVADNTDCNDGSDTVFPGATEMCNGIDDNCSTFIDDAGATDTCNDDEVCTVDLCLGGECVFDSATTEGLPCDSDVCLLAQTCSGGSCTGGTPACDDFNECTSDLCTNNGGSPSCQFNNLPPGTACTGGTCNAEGSCIPS